MQNNIDPKYQFPGEVEQIISLHRVVSAIQSRGLKEYTEDLCQNLVTAIEAAQAKGVDVDDRYAFGILRNLIRKWFRKRKIDIEHLERYSKQRSLKPDYLNPKENLVRIEQCDLALDLLKRWSKQDQTIVVLRAIEGLAFQKIADLLNRPETTVRLKYHEIVKEIGRLMQNDSDAD
jgi:RNA polymerase sigma factor (sigma-70 family)